MGAATAIMSFHTDAEIAKIFEKYYEIFFGIKLENPKIITVPYSMGLAFGIIFFFNHMFGKKLTSDLTPIEIEMSLYEQDIYKTQVDLLEKNNGENHD